MVESTSQKYQTDCAPVLVEVQPEESLPMIQAEVAILVCLAPCKSFHSEIQLQEKPVMLKE